MRRLQKHIVQRHHWYVLVVVALFKSAEGQGELLRFPQRSTSKIFIMYHSIQFVLHILQKEVHKYLKDFFFF